MIGSNIKDKVSRQERIPKYGESSKNETLQLNRDEYEALLSENEILKKIISDRIFENRSSSTNSSSSDFGVTMKQKTDFTFYLKIILAISVIILALAFHIVYLSVASCLFYTNGSSGCWIKSWLGMTVNASFFIDLTLYLLIGLQVLLIILIIKHKLNAMNLIK